MRLAVYTCVLGGYDHVVPPRQTDESIEYLCFTDSPESVPAPWRAIAVTPENESLRDVNRRLKIQFHTHPLLRDFDATLYVDGSIEIVGDLRELVAQKLDTRHDIFMFRHPHRTTTYAEGAACAEAGHDWLSNIAPRLRHYFREGFPDDSGLFMGGVILRRNTDSCRRLMDLWWAEYLAGSRRDQLSLGYVSWKLGVPVGTLGDADPFFEQRYFRLRRHAVSTRRVRISKRLLNYTAVVLLGYPRLFERKPPSDFPTLWTRIKRR